MFRTLTPSMEREFLIIVLLYGVLKIDDRQCKYKYRHLSFVTHLNVTAFSGLEP